MDLLPDPPRIDQPQMTLTPSCHERSTGKIFIPSSAITTSEANISWVLRKGYDTSPCAGSNCAANTVRNNTGSISKSLGITIDDLSAKNIGTNGKYTLLLTNYSSDNFNNCFTPVTFEITKYAPLRITANPASPNINITCRGASTGQITVNASGGN